MGYVERTRRGFHFPRCGFRFVSILLRYIQLTLFHFHEGVTGGGADSLATALRAGLRKDSKRSDKSSHY